MNSLSSSTKKWLIISISIVMLVIFIALALDKLIFRQTGSDPSLNNIATSSTSLKLSFSQPLESVGKVSIDDTIINSITIDGSTINIPFQNIELTDGITYRLDIEDIHSKWFNNKIMQIMLFPFGKILRLT